MPDVSVRFLSQRREKYSISLELIWILTWKMSSASKIQLLFSLPLTSAPSLHFLILEGEWCFVICSSCPSFNCWYIKPCSYKPAGFKWRIGVFTPPHMATENTLNCILISIDMHLYTVIYAHAWWSISRQRDHRCDLTWPWSELDHCHVTSPSHLSVLEYGERSALVIFLKGSFHWLWRAWITLQTWLGIFGLQMSWKQAILNGRRAVTNNVSPAPHLTSAGAAGRRIAFWLFPQQSDVEPGDAGACLLCATALAWLRSVTAHNTAIQLVESIPMLTGELRGRWPARCAAQHQVTLIKMSCRPLRQDD